MVGNSHKALKSKLTRQAQDGLECKQKVGKLEEEYGHKLLTLDTCVGTL